MPDLPRPRNMGLEVSDLFTETPVKPYDYLYINTQWEGIYWKPAIVNCHKYNEIPKVPFLWIYP